MKTTDFNQHTSSHKLNENLYKKFGVKVNFDKYSREQLEDARNKIRTEIHQLEAKSNFNDLLTNEAYQKNKQLVGLLNTRIKEMLGESISIMERKLSNADKKKKKGDPNEGNAFGKAVRDAKADGVQKGEKIKVGGKEYPVKEGAKPDFLDMDKDGDKKEPMKKAVADKGDTKPAAKKGMSDKQAKYFGKKDESVEEGFPTVADAQARAATEKTTGKFDKKDVSTGTVYTKRHTKSDAADHKAEKKVKESFPTVAAATAAAEKKKTTGKFDKKDVGTGTQYTRKASTFTDGGDDSDTKRAKKKMKESQHKQNVKFVNESIRRLINEDEEGKAKAITAGTDMVNDFTSWMTRVGQYQTKSMIELADAIRANMGQEQSETFKQAVAPALETALNTLTQAREQLSNAVAVLAGESSPMDTMGADMSGGMDGAEPGMDSMNAGNEEVPMDDEFGAADAAAGGSAMSGREMRESRKLFAAKLNEAHGIISRLSK